MPFLPELMPLVRSRAYKTNSVRIFHPACRELLLSLPAIPHPPLLPRANTPHGAPSDGVDLRLVMDACHIITNHTAKAPDCYLSTDIPGQNPVGPYSDSDGLLQLAPGDYYYQPGSPSVRAVINYPIVTDFSAWRFPSEEDIPAHWKRPRSVDQRIEPHWKHVPTPPEEFEIDVILDGHLERRGCMVTKQLAACRVVRLVPLELEDWFERNGLNQYNWGPELGDGSVPESERGTGDPANGVVLRLNVESLLENHHFVFFPAGDGRFMTYLCGWSFNCMALLHRRLVTFPLRVADEFLYARFGHGMINNPRLLGGFANTFPVPEGIQPSEPSWRRKPETESTHND